MELTYNEKCLATPRLESRYSGGTILEMTRQSETRNKATACHLCQQEARLEATGPPAMRKQRQRTAMTG